MTRDGVVEVNETQQTAERISSREADSDFSQPDSAAAERVIEHLDVAHTRKANKKAVKKEQEATALRTSTSRLQFTDFLLISCCMLSFCYRVGKLLSDCVGFLTVHFSRFKGLYQMVGEIVSLIYGLCKRKSKLNICRFIATPKGGHKHFPVCFIRVLDIVKGFAQRAFNRLNLCNRHISASTPFISSMSSW